MKMRMAIYRACALLAACSTGKPVVPPRLRTRRQHRAFVADIKFGRRAFLPQIQAGVFPLFTESLGFLYIAAMCSGFFWQQSRRS